ncbi:MAG: DUF4363 family protein [Faecousia sp.]
MKRFWLGIAILAVLLGLSFAVQGVMGKIHNPMAEDLERSADFALAGDWEQATHYYAKARHTWEHYHGMTASVADHSPMDELDMLFAELSALCAEKETVHFAATCRSASRMAEAMADAHTFAWWNLL